MNESKLRKAMGLLGLRDPEMTQNGWLNTPCPFAPWRHPNGVDRRPSFGLKIEPGKFSHYYCFSCKASGHLWDLAADLGRLMDQPIDPQPFLALEVEGGLGDFEDHLSASTSQPNPEPLDEAAYGDLYEPAWNVPQARDYLISRKVDRGVAELLGLGFDPNESRITFPVRDFRNRLFGFTGRSVLQPREYPFEWYPKIRDYFSLPKSEMLLGAQLFTPGKRVVLVEGLFGVAWLHGLRIPAELNAVPLATMGAKLHPQQAAALLDMQVTDVTLLFDPDEAGDLAVWGHEKDGLFKGGARNLLAADFTVRIPAWPEGRMDVDELSAEDVCDVLSSEPV